MCRLFFPLLMLEGFQFIMNDVLVLFKPKLNQLRLLRKVFIYMAKIPNSLLVINNALHLVKIELVHDVLVDPICLDDASGVFEEVLDEVILLAIGFFVVSIFAFFYCCKTLIPLESHGLLKHLFGLRFQVPLRGFSLDFDGLHSFKLGLLSFNTRRNVVRAISFHVFRIVTNQLIIKIEALSIKVDLVAEFVFMLTVGCLLLLNLWLIRRFKNV